MTVRNTRILFVVFFVFAAAAAINAIFLQSGPTSTPAGRLAAERAQKDAEIERKRRLGLGVADTASSTPPAASAASAVVAPIAPQPLNAAPASKSVAEKQKTGAAIPRAVQMPPQPQNSTQGATTSADDGARRLARLKPNSWRSNDTPRPNRPDADLLPDAPDAEGDAATISAVQRELNHRGYGPLTADGVPGLATRAAILAFEFDTGASLTAEATETLLKRLLLGGPSDTAADQPGRVKTARAEALIRTVQQSLVTLGYDVGRVDGRFGEETQRALKSFEGDEGLTPRGRISAEVFARLARAIAVAKVQPVR